MRVPRSAVVLIPLAALLVAVPAAAEVLPSDIALLEDPDGEITAYGSAPNDYLARISCAMRKQGYADRYNAIFVYSAVPFGPLAGTQQGWPVLMRTKGIGRDRGWNMSPQFCTQTGVLRQAVKMGPITMTGLGLPDNPDDRYTGLLMYALSGIELVAHEFGHQWLASIRFDKGDGAGPHCYVRAWEGSSEPQPGDVYCDGMTENGYNQHWSYYFNSRSVMYGSMIDDLGNGKFNFYYKNPKFSQLDQYLMGLRRPGEVDPMFLVDTGDNSGSAAMPSTMMMNGVEVEGTRVDFTIADVIRAEGERIPASEPCHWKGITVLVWNEDYKYTPAMLDKLARYANRWEEFYDWATDHRGSFDMTIDGRGYGTATCPSALGPPPADGTQPPDEGTVAEEVRPDPGTTSEEVGPKDVPQPPDWSNIDFGGADPGPGRDAPGGDTTVPLDAFLADGACVPGTYTCYGDNVVTCAQDGSGWLVVQHCADGGYVCRDGVCATPRKDGGCTAGGRAPTSPWFLLVHAFALLAVRGIRRRSCPARGDD